jgi:4-hydroxybenzoate polyprenyltransferase
VNHSAGGTAASTIASFASLVKFSHTVFAMPFALAVFVLLSPGYSVTLTMLLWILLALVSARTAAMAYNRLVDRDIDRINPRTRSREIPAGILSVQAVCGLLAASSVLFFLSAGMLGAHCLLLSPIVLVVLLFYSHTKRFTSSAHLFLGLALALAPGGVWYAVTGGVAWTPIPLMAAVLFWVAGFDVLYSCQDVTFDQEQRLHSIPVRIGVPHALRVSWMFHLLAFLLLCLFGSLMQLGGVYFATVLVFSGVMFSQHLLVSAEDLSRINAAFFTRNGVGSILFFLGCCVEVWVT